MVSVALALAQLIDHLQALLRFERPLPLRREVAFETGHLLLRRRNPQPQPLQVLGTQQDLIRAGWDADFGGLLLRLSAFALQLRQPLSRSFKRHIEGLQVLLLAVTHHLAVVANRGELEDEFLHIRG